jgi:hypothetical protein
LLGLAKGRREEIVPGLSLGYCEIEGQKRGGTIRRSD